MPGPLADQRKGKGMHRHSCRTLLCHHLSIAVQGKVSARSREQRLHGKCFWTLCHSRQTHRYFGARQSGGSSCGVPLSKMRQPRGLRPSMPSGTLSVPSVPRLRKSTLLVRIKDYSRNPLSGATLRYSKPQPLEPKTHSLPSQLLLNDDSETCQAFSCPRGYMTP